MSAFQPVLNLLPGILNFVIVIPILVAVHELGHYLAARMFGMHVDAFAVMMGGLRKTKLEPYLMKPIAPASQVWLFGLMSLVALVAGIALKSGPTTLAGLALLGIVLPVWVVSRLGALYHLELSKSVGTLGKVWGAAVFLSLIATKGHGLEFNQLLSLLAIASFVATLIVYYHPVFRKSEEAPQGHGQIDLPSFRLNPAADAVRIDGETSRLQVRFRPVWHRTNKHGTEFSLLLLPLGGFASIKGMHPKEDGSETKIEGGFYSKSPFARFCVLFAGPLFSIVFGVLVLAGSLSITGERQPLTDPVIGHLDEKGPGYLAGLREGDRFLTVNGEPVAVFFDVLKQVRKSHETKDGTEVAVPLTLTIERGLDTKTIVVLPKKDIEPTPVLDEKLQETKVAKIQFKLGISPSLHNVPLPFGQAIAKAAMQPIEMVKGLAETFSKPAKIADNLGGPVSIAREMGAASKEGTSTVVTLAGLLSISLGVMNLLPIVPFDGGQIVVAIAEMFRGGKRLSLQLQSILSTVGVFLIFILMMTVVTIDISHTVGK